jgi:hypothetical protein
MALCRSCPDNSTATPGSTAPLLSTIFRSIRPVNSCADAGIASVTIAAANNMIRTR